MRNRIVNKEEAKMIGDSSIKLHTIFNPFPGRVDRVVYFNHSCEKFEIRKVYAEDGDSCTVICETCKAEGMVPKTGKVAVLKARKKIVRTKYVEACPESDVWSRIQFSIGLARRLNRVWCKRFNLRRKKIVVRKMRKKHVYGLHSNREGKIYIFDHVPERDKWKTFIHEVAHYRVWRHCNELLEEMNAINVYLTKWLEKKMMKGKLDKYMPEMAGKIKSENIEESL
jgi:hypothetical protein